MSSTECARCGACSVVCPVFKVDPRESLTARGKLHLLSLPFAEEPSGHFQDIFSRCLLCGACEQTCSRHLPITDLIIRARGRFPRLYGAHSLHKEAVRQALAHPSLLKGLVKAGNSLQRINRLPARSGLRLKLGLLEQPASAVPVNTAGQFAESGDNPSYFTGCLARYLQPSVGRATVRLAEVAGYSLAIPPTQGCCGLAAVAAGRESEARQLAWKNIQAFADHTGPILTSCASCSSHLATYPELFKDDPKRLEKARNFAERVAEFSSFFLAESLSYKSRSGKQLKVFWHDPCHLRFSVEGRENPRNLIDQLKNIEQVESGDGAMCCGQGGLFHLGYPELSMDIFRRCAANALDCDPDMVVTTCSGCLMQWQTGRADNNLAVEVSHLAVLLADCLEKI